MKKSKRHASVRVGLRGFHIVLLFFLILFFIAGYYVSKVHERFGLKRYVSFAHPYCKEPLINNPIELKFQPSQYTWETFEDKELGIHIQKPADWKISYDCPTHMCISSPDFDGIEGQIIRIARIDKRLGFPYESYYVGSRPTNIFEYLQMQRNCANVEINGIHGVRQSDTTSYLRRIYALDEDEASYILIQENLNSNESSTELLDGIVASFVSVPIEPSIVDDLGPYNGIPSPRVTYKQLSFEDVDVYANSQIEEKFSDATKRNRERLKGYTFIVYKGDKVVFELIRPGSMNGLDNTSLELYSYGPTILYGESRLEWRAPVTGRYFLVLKDASGETQDRPFWLRIRIDQ